MDAVGRISLGQNKDPEYADDAPGTILKHVQESIDGLELNCSTHSLNIMKHDTTCRLGYDAQSRRASLP